MFGSGTHLQLLTRRTALGIAFASGALARAQHDADLAIFEPAPARLSLRFDAMLWYLGPGGHVDMPGGVSGDARNLDLRFMGFDSPLLAPMPEAHIEWDRWRLGFRGYAFASDRNVVPDFSDELGNVVFGPTTRLDSSLDFSSFEVELAREVYHFPVEVRGMAHPDFLGKVELLGGVRMFDVDWRVSRTVLSGPPLGGDDSTSTDEVFIEPMVGTRLEMLFGEDFGIDCQLNLGGMFAGDRSSNSFDVLVGGWWRPHPQIAIQIGYRAAFFGLSTGEGADKFEFTGSNQGVQVGLIFFF